MKTIKVVIGANYGDEGKGLITNYLCNISENPLVIMTNGGCQRGHTVVDNVRHVFHHFGSGTLSGIGTYFPSTYFMNPIEFTREFNELNKQGIDDFKLFRNNESMIQLPGDILINQLLELERKKTNSEHGSCGWGIYETVLRIKKGSKVLTSEFSELSRSDKIDLIKYECNKQIKDRLFDSNIKLDDKLYSLFMSSGFINHFIDDFEFMNDKIEVVELDDLIDSYETFIFENSQGLLLDITYNPFDKNGNENVNTTPSLCGVNGVIECINKNTDKFISNIKSSQLIYVTRSYLTRHGAGEFPEEVYNNEFVDKTNIYNEWQGNIRYGAFNKCSILKLINRVRRDSYIINNIIESRITLAITHFNKDIMNYKNIFDIVFDDYLLSNSENWKEVISTKE